MAKAKITQKQEMAIREIEALVNDLKRGDDFLSKIAEVDDKKCDFSITYNCLAADDKRRVSFGLLHLSSDFVKSSVRSELEKKADKISKLAKEQDLDLEDNENALVETYKKSKK